MKKEKKQWCTFKWDMKMLDITAFMCWADMGNMTVVVIRCNRSAVQKPFCASNIKGCCDVSLMMCQYACDVAHQMSYFWVCWEHKASEQLRSVIQTKRWANSEYWIIREEAKREEDVNIQLKHKERDEKEDGYDLSNKYWVTLTWWGSTGKTSGQGNHNGSFAPSQAPWCTAAG